jgi:hypothetical protein
MTQRKRRPKAKAGRKPRKKKTVKNRVRLTPRQSKLLKGIIVEGKSVHKAALEAGYSPRTAHNPGDLLDTRKMREALSQLLTPIEEVAARINEGLDAERTEFAKFEGRISDQVDCVDFEQRRKYAELNLRLRGLLTDPELDGGKPPDSITVNFVHVATLQEA